MHGLRMYKPNMQSRQGVTYPPVCNEINQFNWLTKPAKNSEGYLARVKLLTSEMLMKPDTSSSTASEMEKG